MVWDRLKADANEELDRRKLLQVVGSSAVGAFAGAKVVSAHGGTYGSPGDTIDEFHVQGRYVEIRRDRPDYYEITRRTVSPDLRERYGDPVVESTRRFEKSRLERQALPSDGEVRVENDSYSALMAKEDEWQEYFDGRREASSQSASASLLPLSTGPGSYPELSDHDADDDSYPYAVWTYEQDDGVYTRSSPINIIWALADEPEECKEIDGVIEQLVNAGWTDDIAEYERYAWNRVTEEFESNQDGGLDNGSAGESWGRANGGHHIRMWTLNEDEDDYDSDDYHGHYVCGQGHFDSRVPHAGTGYECTKAEAEEIFGDAFNWYVYPDYFDLDNESGSEPDDCTTDTDDSPYHNGSATAITWTECSNVGAEGTDHHHEGPADGC